MSVSLALRPRHLAWLPALLLAALALCAAAGVDLVRPSHAASTGNVTVSASVAPELHIGGTCPGATLSGVSMGSGDGTTALGTCTLTFGTNNNNPGGSLLRVETPRATAGDETLCSTAVTASCGTTRFIDALTTGAAALADGEFGVQVSGIPTCNTPTWTNGNYYGLEDAATALGAGNLVCDHNVFGSDASYSLTFAANPAGSTIATTYQGRADFTVEAS